MIRGTTPELTFTVPFDPNTCKQIWITFSQNNKEVFTIDKTNCKLKEDSVIVRLHQSQTLQLQPNNTVQIQMRATFASQTQEEDDAIASEIVTTTVGQILRDGEIQ